VTAIDLSNGTHAPPPRCGRFPKQETAAHC
jgi:hypothetical protein